MLLTNFVASKLSRANRLTVSVHYRVLSLESVVDLLVIVMYLKDFLVAEAALVEIHTVTVVKAVLFLVLVAVMAAESSHDLAETLANSHLGQPQAQILFQRSPVSFQLVSLLVRFR